jgi:trigger factor
VNTIKIKELPLADDEFAKDVSEFNTLEEYADSLRAKLMETAQKRADSEFEKQIVGMAVENATVQIPDAMIESELDSMIEEQSQRMSYQGIELDQYLKYIGQDMEAFREGLKDSAKTRAKTHLVIEAIGKAEAIVATSEEIDEEIKKIAEMYKMPEEDIRKQFGADSSYFSQDIIVRKTVELLKTEAKADTKAAKAEKKAKTEPKAKAEAKPKAKAKAKEDTKGEDKE